ncbi:hypothetical protein AKJ47_01380 [candidate division MSBL1 archaeon SCGC-AAA261G05]|uniref:DUF1616 domain-containing protein n=1 Tax=candidate division MSBL1 archaeon SCGC-AAA261G05 TaxID=1698276 RepID=A0A133VBY8_9EURY|nr:hypothetical protein AKJ47_01380 [candidate division MSBL1 archaeon SCGC-AAA261G05]
MQIDETNRDLLALDALGGVLILTILLTPTFRALRVILGVPFVLFLPGYFLVSALFPGRDDLEGIERLALSLGLSLALVPLIGLMLNYTPFGIRLWPVTLSLFGFMLAMTWIAQFRRERIAPKERFSIDFSSHLPSWGEIGGEDKLLIVGSIIAIIGAGVGASYLASNRHGEEFTEFYVLGPGGMMENYPTDLEVGGTGTVILGVVNHEYQDENYHIILTLENEPLKEIGDIQLGHEENWEEEVTFKALEDGENEKLEFLLYKDDSVEPYRTLHLWLNVRESK